MKIRPIYLLVDGSNIIWRAVYAERNRQRLDDDNRGAAEVALNMIKWCAIDYHASFIAVAFDGASRYRKSLYPEYKAGRKQPETADLVNFNLARLRVWQACQAAGIPVVEDDYFEADDLIGTWAAMAVEAGGKAVVVSSDGDMTQLVDQFVHLARPIHGKPFRERELLKPGDVEMKYGYSPAEYLQMRAFIADNSDNIKGVTGIGKVWALKLIRQYGNVETVFDSLDEIEPAYIARRLQKGEDDARLAAKLSKIVRDVPELSLPEAEPDMEALEQFL